MAGEFLNLPQNIAPWFPPADAEQTPEARLRDYVASLPPPAPPAAQGPFDQLRQEAASLPVLGIYNQSMGIAPPPTGKIPSPDFTVPPPAPAGMTHGLEPPNPLARYTEAVKQLPAAMLQRYVVNPVNAAKSVTEQMMRGERVSDDPEAVKRAWDAIWGASSLGVTGGLMPGGILAAPRGSLGAMGGGKMKTFYEISREYPSRQNDAFHRGAGAYQRGEVFQVPPSNLTKEELRAWDDGVEARMRFEAQPQKEQ